MTKQAKLRRTSIPEAMNTLDFWLTRAEKIAASPPGSRIRKLYAQRCEKASAYAERHLTPIDEGSFRVAYECEGAVLKVPKGYRYLLHNVAEAFAHQLYVYFPVASASLHPWTGIFRIPIILMEHIHALAHDPCPYEVPDEELWVFDVDSQQVGYNSVGELVAYDFAQILPSRLQKL